jgi:hypothetical protein
MNKLIQTKAGEIIEAVIARGDIAALTPEDRARYYSKVCESVGLNPMTRPFEYITLNGKLTLYARKDCTDQLRSIHKVSITDLVETEREGVFIVTAKVMNGEGRMDAAKGAVSIVGLKGEALANALMKAETKAKRRATLSICGLGFLDETEVEDIPPEAKGPRTTLPKKDAKDIYIRLQKEIDAATDRPAFKQWMLDNAERIGTMPEDWQDVLRLRAQEKIVDLQNGERRAAETVDAETGEVTDRVIWEEDGERPATAADIEANPPDLILRRPTSKDDPMGIPEALKRLTPKQEALWLDLLKSVAAAAPDVQTMMDLQATHMGAAQQRKVSSAAWVEAVRIFRERVQWLTDNPTWDAETWLAGDLAGALSGAETWEQLAAVKDKMLIPGKDRLTAEQWKKAVAMYRGRLDEISPENILAGG